MTEKNMKIREKVKAIEALATRCLNSQPEGDEDCELHLSGALARIADVAGEFAGCAELEVYDIEWDTDDKDPGELGLPDKIRIMVDLGDGRDVGDAVAGALAERSGWLVKSLRYRRI